MGRCSRTRPVMGKERFGDGCGVGFRGGDGVISLPKLWHIFRS